MRSHEPSAGDDLIGACGHRHMFVWASFIIATLRCRVLLRPPSCFARSWITCFVWRREQLRYGLEPGTFQRCRPSALQAISVAGNRSDRERERQLRQPVGKASAVGARLYTHCRPDGPAGSRICILREKVELRDETSCQDCRGHDHGFPVAGAMASSAIAPRYCTKTGTGMPWGEPVRTLMVGST